MEKQHGNLFHTEFKEGQVNYGEQYDLDVFPTKPVQDTLTGAEFLDHPSIRPILGISVHEWTPAEIVGVALALSNRRGIVLTNETTTVKQAMFELEGAIDWLTNNNSEFVRVADPLMLFMNYIGAGAWPPPNYYAVLGTINALQGGVAANMGAAGQPIEFADGSDRLLLCTSPIVYQRVAGAIADAFPGEFRIVKMNPTALVIH